MTQAKSKILSKENEDFPFAAKCIGAILPLISCTAASYWLVSSSHGRKEYIMAQ